jgi:hypothetical protein
MRDRDLDIIDPNVEHSVDDCRAVAVTTRETIQRKGMQVKAGDHLAVIDVREAEPHESARPGSELESHLLLKHVGERLVRRRLPRLTAQQHISEHTINADGSNKMIVMLVEEREHMVDVLGDALEGQACRKILNDLLAALRNNSERHSE